MVPNDHVNGNRTIINQRAQPFDSFGISRIQRVAGRHHARHATSGTRVLVGVAEIELAAVVALREQTRDRVHDNVTHGALRVLVGRHVANHVVEIEPVASCVETRPLGCELGVAVGLHRRRHRGRQHRGTR